MHKTQNKTVHHIFSGYEMLAATQYLYRKNQVAKYVHWIILRALNIQVSELWLEHEPQECITKDSVNIMQGSYPLTDNKNSHNHPDITIHNTNTRRCTNIDMDIPVCQNEMRKTVEKINKYRAIKIKLQKCWNVKKCQDKCAQVLQMISG